MSKELVVQAPRPREPIILWENVPALLQVVLTMIILAIVRRLIGPPIEHWMASHVPVQQVVYTFLTKGLGLH